MGQFDVKRTQQHPKQQKNFLSKKSLVELKHGPDQDQGKQIGCGGSGAIEGLALAKLEKQSEVRQKSAKEHLLATFKRLEINGDFIEHLDEKQCIKLNALKDTGIRQLFSST